MFKKGLPKMISFALVTAILICALFTMSAVALEIDEEFASATPVVLAWGENGEPIDIMAAAACCSKPNIEDYEIDPRHAPKQGICTIYIKKYCHNCGYTLDSTTTVVNGHGARICCLPKW